METTTVRREWQAEKARGGIIGMRAAMIVIGRMRRKGERRGGDRVRMLMKDCRRAEKVTVDSTNDTERFVYRGCSNILVL